MACELPHRFLRCPISLQRSVRQQYATWGVLLLQVLLGGLSHWTVGLLATFTAVACIIAADVGAFFFGKAWGRTKLTDISPKKTVEGAAGGLLCSSATAMVLSRFLQWPVNPLAAAVLVRASSFPPATRHPPSFTVCSVVSASSNRVCSLHWAQTLSWLPDLLAGKPIKR